MTTRLLALSVPITTPGKQKGARAGAEQTAADAALVQRIRIVHAADRTLGAPSVTVELNDGACDGELVNHRWVARVTRAVGITGYVKQRRVR